MDNKTIIEFGFGTIWRIMEISEGVIRFGLRITPSSFSIILHKILNFIHSLLSSPNPYGAVKYYSAALPFVIVHDVGDGDSKLRARLSKLWAFWNSFLKQQSSFILR